MQPTEVKQKVKLSQPLDVLEVDDALLKQQTVSNICGMSRSTLYTKMSEVPPTFPQPIRLGKRCTRWRAGDIKAYLQGLAKSGAA